MKYNEILSILEGLLFVSGEEGIRVEDVMHVFEVSKKEAYQYLDDLQEVYRQKEIKGFDLYNFGGIYRFMTLKNYFPYYRKMIHESPSKMSKSALETLAIIAYYQPITRIKIEEIRGVGCESMIRKLLAKALIKEVGREDSLGKPILYGVTDEFMNAFSLVSLDELPKLEEMNHSLEEDLFSSKYTENEKENA